MADGNRRGLTRGHLVEILRFLRDLYLRDDGADDKNALKYQMNLAIRDMRDVPRHISMAARNLPRGMCADDHAYPIEELISRILSGEDIDTVLGDNTICRITIRMMNIEPLNSMDIRKHVLSAVWWIGRAAIVNAE